MSWCEARVEALAESFPFFILSKSFSLLYYYHTE